MDKSEPAQNRNTKLLVALAQTLDSMPGRQLSLHLVGVAYLNGNGASDCRFEILLCQTDCGPPPKRNPIDALQSNYV